MTEASVPVLVTAVGGYGQQIVNALRRSGRNYFIVGTNGSTLCPQLQQCDVGEVVPLAGSAGYAAALDNLMARHGVRAVFPGSEPELLWISRNADLFRKRNVLLPICPPHVLSICLDKGSTTRWLSEQGFATPRFCIVDDLSHATGVDFFPVVLKPRAQAGGSRDVFIAQTMEELRCLALYLDRAGGGFIVQEYVGTPEQEYTVGVLHDMDGRIIDAIAMRRHLQGALHVRASVVNRTGRRELGPYLVVSSGVSHGEIGRFPAVTEQCRRIAERLGARGPINVQCRLVGDRVFPFEINPRFSGTTGLRAMVGFNEPDELISIHLRGKSPAPIPYRHATIMRTLAEFEMQQGASTGVARTGPE